jgi:hypothetical protein
MKFKVEWTGVKAGEIYPTEFAVGDECPPELLEAAESLGVLEDQDAAKPARKKAGKAE